MEAGKVKRVIVKDLSRFGRDYLQVGMFTEVLFAQYDIHFIAIANNVDSQKGENDLTPFVNLFNEWYARDCSRKQRAVKRAKGISGKRIASIAPYGYISGEDGKLIPDEETAWVVKLIYDLCIQGYGTTQIANELTRRNIPTPGTLAFRRTGSKRNYCPGKEFVWVYRSIDKILSYKEYLGHTVNFKTYSKSYKLKKRIPNEAENMFIVPDTQEAIVSQAQWDRVQELRKNKRRPVKAERQGLFAGLVYCADCGSKLHFATCKGFEGKQDHYRCSKYKSGRGECSAHYIREDVLRELVLERIQAVNAYIRSDVEGFQEEWLHYRRADQERDIREDQKRMEQAKKRLATLDVVISRLYEDYALGEISKEKYKKMTADYEAEQERLKLEIETTEEWVAQRQAMGDDLDTFIALTKKYVDVTELTQTIVNEYIKKIIIHAPDKSGGKRRQKVEIFFNFVDDVEIPVLAEPMIAESTLGRRKTA